ncbi:hypothetical protein BH10PSE2_BH10PSE2_22720 [soil metagenome]
MRFGWVRAVGLVALLTVSACQRGESGASGSEAAQNATDAAAFMAANAKAAGVQTLASGLQYKIVASGPAGAASPDRNDLVRVDYEGALTDGTVFDSSFAKGQPYVTTPEEVVPGWTEALQRMRVGDEWMLYVPPALGYKDQDAGKIPPNSVLVFRIKLLDVAPVPGGAVRGTGLATG